MLYIHLPLKLGDSPRGQWHTYLVIPAECLDTSNINATSRLDVVSSAGPQFEKAGVKPGTELVRCHFQLKELGCAFMALPETQKQISAHFRGLLLSLKSLANADTFQIYLPKTAETWDTLHAFFQTLNSGMCTSPEIDKRASFNSRGVGENDWKAYGIDDEEPPAVGWNPIIQEGPPPYEQAIHEPGRNAANVVDVLGVSSPHPDSSSLPRPSSAQSIPDTETAFASDNSIHDGQNEDKADGAERHAADHGGSNDRQERGGDSPAEGHPQPPRPPKRKAGRVFSDAESPGRRCAHGHRSDKAGCRRPTAREAEEERRAAHSVGIPFAVHQSCAEFEATAVTLLLKDVLIAPGSIFDQKGRNRVLFDESQFRWFCDAALWFRTAWTMRHYIHGTYAPELIAMCQAISVRNRPTFEAARAKCIEVFIKDERVAYDEGPWAFELADRPQWITSFVYQSLGAGADTLIMDELAALRYLVGQWQRAGGEQGEPKPGRERDYAQRELSFNTQMVSCILIAFYKVDL